MMALFSLVSISAFGENVKGMIYTRTGETLIVKSASGNVTVVLTDSTKTKDDTGLFGLGTEKMSSVVLIPGLKVDVDGVTDTQGRVIATTITVDGDDLETSEMIQAGLHPTAKQVEANIRSIEQNERNISTNSDRIVELEKKLNAQSADRQQSPASRDSEFDARLKDIEASTNRFSTLADYETKAQVNVRFDVGSSTLSPEDEEGLKRLAETATGLTGYIIEVTGYADSTGSAAMNTKLSEDRAKSVIISLMQQGGVPVRHIVAPGAMGEYGPVASNETDAGRAENRRVEVKVLVNKGIAGK
jgi:outer membrane protein OmpA-like peptidoglycan-associated protein